MTTAESDFWNDVHVSSGTVFQDALGGERGRYYMLHSAGLYYLPGPLQTHSCTVVGWVL